MREGAPSLTAAAVAVARALAPRQPDPYAPIFLPRPLGAALAAIARSALGRRAARRLSLGLVDHIALRTATIDRALTDALEAGARQVVLLGAGLDARAWRLAPDALFFEVDHRATQERKRARARVLGRPPRFVPVDFARERLADALARAGHDASVPTAWIWEGVTMYLPPRAVRETLQQVAERSAPGSRLVATYLADEALRLEPAVRAVFRACLDEPLLSSYTPAAFRRELEAAGFRPLFDGNSRSWETAMGGDPQRARLLQAERMTIAAR